VTLVLVAGTALTLARLGRPYLGVPLALTTTPETQGASDLQLRRRVARAERVLAAVRPRDTFLVVDTYRNRLSLYKDGELVRTSVCSTGTGVVLKDPRNGRTWVFDTPLGERIVERKVRNPIWAKPDWAFIEEGFKPPPPDSPDRFDDVSLGDYALYMGDGYIIHGTLFKTLLGRRVTHGCIRLGDDDLEYVYHHARIGTRVFLY
jgi:L,D-transpeptidase ErfK/SrfK